MKHSVVSPSRAKIWTRCTEFQQIERENNFAGNAGTRLHALAEKALVYGTEAEYPVKGYVDYVRSRGEAVVEQAVPLFPLLPLEDYRDVLGQGYCDAYIYKNQHLEVIDLKTGRIEVSPERNLQLAIYAYCIINNNNLLVSDVTLTIYQGKAESWALTYPDLRKLILSEVRPAVMRVLGGARQSEPGDFCQYCNKQDSCPAYLGELKPEPELLTPRQILDKAQQWSVLSSKIKDDIRDGAVSIPPDVKVTEYTSYSWIKDVELPDYLYKLTPIKPTQSLLDEHSELLDKVEKTIVKRIQ